MDFRQKSYHNWKEGKREEAIGVIITLPEKYNYLFDKIQLTFVGKEFQE